MSQTITQTTQPVQDPNGKAERFLAAWGSIIQSGDKKGKTTEIVLTSKSENDVLKRMILLDGKIKKSEADERFAEVIEQAKQDYASLDLEIKAAQGQKAQGKKVEWKPLYVKLSTIDATFDKVLLKREKAEVKGQKSAPEAVEIVTAIEKLLTDKRLSEAQRQDFSGQLSGVRKGLVAVGFAKEQERAKTAQQVTELASQLRGTINQAISDNQIAANPLRKRYGAAMNILNGLPDDDSDQTGNGEKIRAARLSASTLLREADGALAVCDFTLVGEQLTAAEQALATVSNFAEQPKDAQEITRAAMKLVADWAGFLQTHGAEVSNTLKQLKQQEQDVPKGAEELYERSRNIGMNADEQLRSILFMVGNAPASASEATVMLANCRKQVGTAMMLMQQDATVSICHKYTRDLAIYTLLADILVVAAGVPNLIVGQMVRRGAVVIDVGINRLPDGRVVGDVDFEAVSKVASVISPVPGGVGPMTVTMLIYNTLRSAERSVGVVEE